VKIENNNSTITLFQTNLVHNILSTMIPPQLFKAATRTWPFLYILTRRLSVCSAFVLPIKTSGSSVTRITLSSGEITRNLITMTKSVGVSIKPPFTSSHLSSSNDDVLSSSTTSSFFAMDPYSEKARTITSSLGLSSDQHERLTQLSELVVEWNERLNLISRKDCNLEVVFGRHVLPSVALASLPDFQALVHNQSSPRIVDVGTGGGFPGLPLAVVYSEASFLLVDSVGKKLKAVDEMAIELGLENIQTHHGRAEEIADDPIIGRTHRNQYDICVGRSVTSMPRFCFWIQDLLKKGKDEEGKLVYIIGGKVEENVQSRVTTDVAIDDLLKCSGASDKRTLVLSSSAVTAIAKESGEVKRGKVKQGTKSRSKPNKNKNNSKKRMQDNDGNWNNSKGAWSKKDNSEKKERGYSNFKRYEGNI